MIYTRVLCIGFVIAQLLAAVTVMYGQEIKLCSWNVAKLGKSKSSEQVSFMAALLCSCDVIALQEVNTSPDGAQQTAMLVHQLYTNSGVKWDYNISAPTTSVNAQERERYVYIWKSSMITPQGRAWLDTIWQDEIVREPYIMSFRYKEQRFTLVNFHAVPKKKEPASEIAFFREYPSRLSSGPFIILGDFNTPPDHSVFGPLRRKGYLPVFTSQRTTLRQVCRPDGCLANAYDNFILNPSHFKIHRQAAMHFYTLLDNDMKRSRSVSDHLPVTVTISVL